MAERFVRKHRVKRRTLKQHTLRYGQSVPFTARAILFHAFARHQFVIAIATISTSDRHGDGRTERTVEWGALTFPYPMRPSERTIRHK
jgi:hypothetical protein